MAITRLGQFGIGLTAYGVFAAKTAAATAPDDDIAVGPQPDAVLSLADLPEGPSFIWQGPRQQTKRKYTHVARGGVRYARLSATVEYRTQETDDEEALLAL